MTSQHEHCWHDRVDASPLCCYCEDLPHEMIVAAAAERVKNKAQQDGFRDWAISHLLSRAQECNAATAASNHGDPFLSAKAIAFSQAARELEQRCAPAERTRVEGEQVVKDDVHDWLKEQCSRLLYGQCTTSRCLRRGGYTGGGYSASIATCEAYEVSQALTATTIFSNTRREVETAAHEIANRYFGDYPERAYPKLLAILSHYFPSAAAPADNDAREVCRLLTTLDWIVGYELAGQNQTILDRAQGLALKVMGMSDPPHTTKGDR